MREHLEIFLTSIDERILSIFYQSIYRKPSLFIIHKYNLDFVSLLRFFSFSSSTTQENIEREKNFLDPKIKKENEERRKMKKNEGIRR
jgi:hypothetical protein